MKTDDNKKIPILNHEQFMNFYLDHSYNENMFDSHGHINPKYNSCKKTGTIAQIFEDNWENFYLANKKLIDTYRPSAKEEIRKIIDCKNKDLGCSVFECPKCGDCIFIGNTCKSRFCTSCGYKYKLQRVEEILDTAYNCPHRQIVFTIPKEFRKYFFSFEYMYILFLAVRETIYSILNISYKKKLSRKNKKAYKSKQYFLPGFFAFLHTFGRDLKWNPHIHILIAEMKISDIEIKKWDYFDYNALSKRFQKILVVLMLKHIKEFTSDDARRAYLNHKNGFYVYAEKKKFKSLKEGIEYVCRYCGRCAISENRIIEYKDNKVTFFYNAHEDEEYHEVTVTAFEFMFLLLRHLIPKNFKIIRYYGFYRKKPKLHNKIKKLVDDTKIKLRKQVNKFRLSILKNFKRDPFHCPHCDVKMNYVVLIT